MNTETLQIDLAQKIFNIWDENLLQKINSLISSDDIVGYSANGTPIAAEEYIKEMDEMNAEIDNGTAELLTTDEVRKNIANAYGLD
ncbi:MAG: hypothetical protein LBE36_14065 [Flavobacteriaceae bacterium]|jgi:hypothetical protein|nr:hypothetical protein [Flavobacteriaceae bacterium]